MPYRTTVKRLLDGHWQARCLTAPNGIATMQGDTREEALQKLREEITYQLEFCPCSAVSQDYVELEIVENGGDR